MEAKLPISEKLPTPMAEMCGRLEGMDDAFPLELRRRALALFETTLAHLTAVLVSAYRRSDLVVRQADTATRSLMGGNPTMGVWRDCARHAADAILAVGNEALFERSIREAAQTRAVRTPREVDAYVARVAEIDEDDRPFAGVFVLGDFMDYVIPERNDESHYRASWFEQHAESIAPPFARAIRAMLRSMKWLAEYPIFVANAARGVDGGVEHTGELLIGQSPWRDVVLHLPDPIPLGVPVFDPEGAALDLSPFYVVRTCRHPTCLGRRLHLVIRGLGGREVPTYHHPGCQARAIEIPELRTDWDRLGRRRDRVQPNVFVVSRLQRERVFAGEPFVVELVVDNQLPEALRDLWVEVEVPPGVEILGECRQHEPELPPRRQRLFEFRFRKQGLGQVAFPPARVGYARSPRAIVSRPVQHMPSLFVTLNPFPALVGRDREVRGLLDRLGTPRADRVRLIAVDGVPGVGKTVVVRHALDQLPRRDTVVLHADCGSLDLDDHGPIFALLREFLWDHFSREQVTQRLTRHLGRKDGLDVTPADLPIETLVAVTGELLGLPPFDIGPKVVVGKASAVDDEMRRRRSGLLRTALVDVFRAIASRWRLVLHLDAVQLMHQDSWELLRILVSQLEDHRVLAVLTVGRALQELRSGKNLPSACEVRAALEGMGAEWLPIEPLTPEAMRELFDRILPDHRVTPPVRDAVIGFAKGIPLWLAQALEALRAGGQLAWAPDGWRIGGVDNDQDLGLVFEEVLARRFRGLPAHLQPIVEVASVLGRCFPGTLLARAVGSNDAAFAANEEELREAHGILRASAGNLEFVHEQFQFAVYQALGEDRRRALHRRIAEILEHDGAGASWYTQLAYHWSRAGDPERELDYLQRSAERHFELTSYLEGAQLLARAAERVDRNPGMRDDSWRFDLERNRARMLWMGGRLEEALQCDRENLQRARRLGRHRDTCTLYRLLAATYARLGRMAWAADEAQKGLACARRHHLGDEEHMFQMRLGVVARKRRDWKRAESLLRTCARYARTARRNASRHWIGAESLRQIGILYRLQGRTHDAHDAFRQALDRFEFVKDGRRPFGLGAVHRNLVGLHLQTGDRDAARLHLDRATEYQRHLHDALGESRLLLAEARLLLAEGRPAEARRANDRSAELKRSAADREGEARSVEFDGDVAVAVAAWNDADARYREAADQYRAIEMPWHADHVQIKQLHLALERGENVRAGRILDSLRRGNSAAWDAETRRDFWYAAAECARRDGNRRRALRAIAEIRKADVAQGTGATLDPRVPLLRAALLVDSRQHVKAADLLRESLDHLHGKGDRRLALRLAAHLGVALRRAEAWEDAEQRLRHALHEARAVEDRSTEATVLEELGRLRVDLGVPADGRPFLEEAARIRLLLGDATGLAQSAGQLDSLASECRDTDFLTS